MPHKKSRSPKKNKVGKKQQLPYQYREVLEFFRGHPRKTFNYKQICHQLDIRSTEVKTEVIRILNMMEKEEIIEAVAPGKFRYLPDFSIMTGRVEITSRGAAFVIVDELEEDVHVSPSLTGQAFNGDIVSVELLHQKKGRRPEGRIIEVLERAKTQFVGTIQMMRKFAFLVPDNSRIHVDFFIDRKSLKGCKDGDKALVEFIDWPPGSPNPNAFVVEVLGQAGEHNTEMHAIIAEFGFKTSFEREVEEEAEAFSGVISQDETKKRRDFRDIFTITIDPEDAKDFDDAISYQILPNNHLEIGVHIADVSHYVTEGSLLDHEAYERGTSVYLVDRTVPMLPERLSNDLCSLRPHEDRLAYSVIFEMGSGGKIFDYWIGKTVIHSNHRFSYEEAQEVIEGNSELHAKEIRDLNRIATILRKKRFANGSIAFESDEFRFKLDAEGRPLEVIKKIRKEAHLMIEDFMLLANKTVAKHVSDHYKDQVIPYRVHDAPNPEKMENFISTAKKFGYIINTQSHKTISDTINKMVEETEGKIEANILHPLAIRSMEKAFYTTKETSHFGLAFDYYTHFTSPIRRYPDLLVHRLLFLYQSGRKYGRKDQIEKACAHSSKMEVQASLAERASVKYKQIEFLSEHVGEEFNGIISGVTEWGIYVELDDNHCEGMIRIADLKDDFYEFYEKEMAVVGRKNKRRFTFGDPVTIQVKKANLNKRIIDFSMVYE
ncbi:MAG: ribonuclease R [Bacteroidetes bacterium]|nr:ribonuclease R [Bacteroidota bacterium]